MHFIPVLEVSYYQWAERAFKTTRFLFLENSEKGAFLDCFEVIFEQNVMMS